VRLAVLVLVAGLSCLAAAGSCNGGRPAPNPVPTIATVVVQAPPPKPEAATECVVACERRKSEGCPSGHVPKSLEHCIAMCTAGNLRPIDPSPDCIALVFTCGERCAP